MRLHSNRIRLHQTPGLGLPPVHGLARGQRPLTDERVRAGDHLVQDHSRAPNVTLEGNLLLEHLRRHVQQGATHLAGDHLVPLEELGKAEVNDLDGRPGVPRPHRLHEHNVLRLQVLVDEAVAVHEGQGSQQLLHDIAHPGLTVHRFFFVPKDGVDFVLQLPSSARLHDLADLLSVFEVLVDLDDAGVVQQGHAIDLGHDLLWPHALASQGFLDLLADSDLPRDLVGDLENLPEAALSQLSSERVDIVDWSHIPSNKIPRFDH
mmetsp:Transcript_119867/g.382644  ORF Transcript_119867/g.382644 Transcript_119867/m.382644 type:complete len:263 (-) Transcript_119867:920-1708(-)